MIVDAECGMPLDLGRWECLWEEGGDDSGESPLCQTELSVETDATKFQPALNPDPQNLPPLDPRDRFLLEDPSSSTKAHTSGGPSTPLPQHVAWLRKTEYISRESTNKGSGQEPCVSRIILIYVPNHPNAIITTVENTPRRRLSMSRTARSWPLSRPRSPPPTRAPSPPPPPLSTLTRSSTSRPYGTPTNRVSQLWNRTRCCPTRRFGRMRTICSGSVSGRESGMRMYVRFFAFLSCLLLNAGFGWPDGRPAIGLRDPPANGV